jgi:metal-sulfur cluster biosynthetic enzyme
MSKKEILDRLREIKEPETGTSIVDLGIIDKIIIQDGKYLIYVNFSYLTSSCIACMPIYWTVVRFLVRKIERVMGEERLKYKIIEAGKKEVYAEG